MTNAIHPDIVSRLVRALARAGIGEKDALSILEEMTELRKAVPDPRADITGAPAHSTPTRKTEAIRLVQLVQIYRRREEGELNA